MQDTTNLGEQARELTQSGVDWTKNVLEGFAAWLKTSGVAVGIVLLLMVVAMIVTAVVLKRVKKLAEGRFKDPESKKRVDTLFGIIGKIVRFAILIIGALVLLSEIGVDLGPVLTTVGVLGLAVSFGAQSLVKDLISGFFLLAENQLRVGDIVRVGTHSGTVEDLRLRTVVLRDLDGHVHVIPNGEVQSFINMSKEWSRIVLDIGIAYRENIDRVVAVIEDEAAKMAGEEPFTEEITSPLEVMGVNEWGDSAIVIRVNMNTVPGRQWNVKRKFLWRLKNRFDAENIEIPFPHRTVYWGEPKPGQQQGLELRDTREITDEEQPEVPTTPSVQRKVTRQETSEIDSPGE